MSCSAATLIASGTHALQSNMKTIKYEFLSFLLLTAFCQLLTASAQPRDYARHVNPFIGTGGHGHTFPGATMPFGMVQLSPDTRVDNWDGSSGYHYSDDIIYGFSHTHLSGTGIPDGCDILFMPAVAEYEIPKTQEDKTFGGYQSRFLHSDEIAEPGYYSVKLADRKIKAELTVTPRVGFHRYTFPKSRKAGINLDLVWRDRLLDGDIKIIGKKRIEGYRRSSSWAKNQNVYFVAEFSRTFDEVAVSSNGEKTRSAFFAFSPKDADQVLLKVAISSVSIEGARKNLEAELPGWDFDQVRADAKAAWNKELSKIEVSGGTPDQTTNFYTALYHTMIQPNVFNDVDGRYKGHDGKVHQLSGYAALPPYLRRNSASPKGVTNSPRGSAAGSERRQSRGPFKAGRRKSIAFPQIDGQSPQETKTEHYTVFSLWDTFRAAHPLYTIIDQKRTVDFINTFIRQYEQGGRLPVWELWGEETDTMIGYHAVSVIADAMAKGIKGFDYEKAYAASKHSAELDHFGLAAYKKRGYISMEDEQESVSKTLEYAYNDWCIAQIISVLYTQRAEKYNYTAEQANRDPILQRYNKEADKYSARAGFYENLFDVETGFMRPKKNGGFEKLFAPNEVTFHFTEGNSWVYSFFVPHDVRRLIELHGGRENFAQKLDKLFTTNDKLTGREQPDITGLIGQYAHGNEPSHHIAYLYNYAGQPWKTQKYVRQILDEFYKPTPDGLIGNEDCGQMSAWYVMSASGFYPVTPGFGIYVFGTPLFPELKYHLENGKTFTIRASKVSQLNKYIRNAKLNGRLLDAVILSHEDIMAGGTLEFEMTNEPVTAAFTSVPVSTLPGNAVSVPLIESSGRSFDQIATVTLSTSKPNSKVHYTIDGSTPTIKSPTYAQSFTINSTSTIKAITEDFLSRMSLVAEATFIKKPNDWTVKIAAPYNRQYTGGGDEGLIDGIRGTVNFASGEWQGYQPQDFVATIDLQKETEIKRVGGGFLQAARSWIWMPTRIEFEVSNDNVNFTKVAEIKTDVPHEDMTHTIRDYMRDITPVKARYVRVKANNLGKIPAWHPGAGEDAFIFIDEIFIL